MNYRHHDTLTYRFPRNTIDAFGCDKDTAYAVVRYRRHGFALAKWLIRAGVVGWFTMLFVGLVTI